MAAEATTAYEALRTRYVRGEASSAGIGAIVFHGVLRGMQIVLAERPEHRDFSPLSSSPSLVTPDRALVRVLANMVLQVHSEVRHVY